MVKRSNIAQYRVRISDSGGQIVDSRSVPVP